MAKRAVMTAAAAVCACAVWLIYSLIAKLTGGIPCIIHLITGLYCPGCGTTRAIIELSQLNFYGALRYNPILLLLFPLLAGVTVKALYHYIRYGCYPASGKLDFKVGIGIIVMAALYMVARNTQQFAFLAPVNI